MTSKELELRKKAEIEKSQDHEKTFSAKVYVPEVDIYENRDSLVIKADMPGVDKKNVKINLKDNVLTLEGHVDPGEYEGLRPIYSEYNVGHYSRSFNISERIDQESIEASMDNGCLKLTLPKAEKAKPRQINIT